MPFDTTCPLHAPRPISTRWRRCARSARPCRAPWPACGYPGCGASVPGNAPSISGVGKKQLLAADLVSGDRILPLPRNHPIDECLSHVPLRAALDQDDAVLVEQAPVAFDRDGELAAILK